MPRYRDEGPGVFGYLFRGVLVLVLLGGLGLGAFVMFGDLSRPAEPRSLSVDLPQR
jgi:hypothetical protein